MIWLSIAAMVVTIAISLALMRSSRGDGLGIPLVALGSFAFLYVVQPLRLIQVGVLDGYLTEWQTAKAILISSLMLAFFVAGWLSASRARTRTFKPTWNGRLLWKFGFATASVGLVAYLIFLQRSGGIFHSYSQVHGQAMAYGGNTAYLYDGLWWVLIGAVMMILGAAQSKASKWRRAVPVAFLAGVITHALLTGSRGSLFSAAVSLLVGHAIAYRRKVPLSQALGILALLGCGVLLILGYRGVLHLGEQDTNVTPTLESALLAAASVEEWNQEHGATGNEFIIHSITIDTVDHTGKLDYGVSWIYYLAISPIPRFLWPEKHSPSLIVSSDEITSYTGVPIAAGSACGIVADVYVRFGVLSMLFMYGLGKAIRKLFKSARRLESPLAACAYIMLYAVSLNMFAEGFGSIFIQFGYSMAPVIIFAWSTHRGGRRSKQRQQISIPRQAMSARETSCS